MSCSVVSPELIVCESPSSSELVKCVPTPPPKKTLMETFFFSTVVLIHVRCSSVVLDVFNNWRDSSAAGNPPEMTVNTCDSASYICYSVLFFSCFFFIFLSGKIQTKWFILHPEPSVCHLYQTWITTKWQLSANRTLSTLRRPILHLLMSRASGTIAHTVTQSAVTSQQLFGFFSFLSGDKLSNAFFFCCCGFFFVFCFL